MSIMEEKWKLLQLLKYALIWVFFSTERLEIYNVHVFRIFKM